LIGEIGNKKIFCYKNFRNYFNNSNTNHIRETVEKTLDESARLDDENTNSGFVLMSKQPSYDIYKKTVREIVLLND